MRFIFASENPKPVYGVVVVLIVANWFGDSVRRVVTMNDMQSMSCVFDDATKYFTRIRISLASGIEAASY